MLMLMVLMVYVIGLYHLSRQILEELSQNDVSFYRFPRIDDDDEVIDTQVERERETTCACHRLVSMLSLTYCVMKENRRV